MAISETSDIIIGMEATADAFKCLANPIRRSVLDQLRVSPLSVEQIFTRIIAIKKISLSSLSEHLSLLKRAGMVEVEVRATERIYSLRQDGFEDVLDWAKEYELFWDQKLKRLGDYLDRMEINEEH